MTTLQTLCNYRKTRVILSTLVMFVWKWTRLLSEFWRISTKNNCHCSVLGRCEKPFHLLAFSSRRRLQLTWALYDDVIICVATRWGWNAITVTVERIMSCAQSLLQCEQILQDTRLLLFHFTSPVALKFYIRTRNQAGFLNRLDIVGLIECNVRALLKA